MLVLAVKSGTSVLTFSRFYNDVKTVVLLTLINSSTDSQPLELFYYDTSTGETRPFSITIPTSGQFKSAISGNDFYVGTLEYIQSIVQRDRRGRLYRAKSSNLLLFADKEMDDNLVIVEMLRPHFLSVSDLDTFGNIMENKVMFRPVTGRSLEYPAFCGYFKNCEPVTMQAITDYSFFMTSMYSQMNIDNSPILIKVETHPDIGPLLYNGWYPVIMGNGLNEKYSPQVVDLTLKQVPSQYITLVLKDNAIVNNTYFELHSINWLVDNGVKQAQTLALKYLSPSYIYSSQRPKTAMTLFRLPQSMMIDSAQLFDNFSSGNTGTDPTGYSFPPAPSEGYVKIGGVDNWLIPVTRYAAGMSQGLYHCDKDKCVSTPTYCGTFYYHEPESTTWLAAPATRIRTFVNKLEAMFRLSDKTDILTHVSLAEVTDDEDVNWQIGLVYAYLLGAIPADLQLTADALNFVKVFRFHIPYSDIVEPLPADISRWPTPIIIPSPTASFDSRVFRKYARNYQLRSWTSLLPILKEVCQHGSVDYQFDLDMYIRQKRLKYAQRGKVYEPPITESEIKVIKLRQYEKHLKIYVGREIGMYAAEDIFDQKICTLARARSIDVVRLTHMIGSNQVVHEILDTRDRPASFKNLVFLS